jgi:hypothetical protein
MKYIIATVISLGLALGVSAQKVIRSPRPPQKVVVVRGGFSPFYSPYAFGRPYWGYPYGYYDPFYRPMPSRPSKLDLEIADIKNDYRDRIRSARMDDKLSRKERRAVIQSLKHEREKEIIEAQRSYYKRGSRA